LKRKEETSNLDILQFVNILMYVLTIGVDVVLTKTQMLTGDQVFEFKTCVSELSVPDGNSWVRVS
jgi:hypothetical protein